MLNKIEIFKREYYILILVKYPLILPQMAFENFS